MTYIDDVELINAALLSYQGWSAMMWIYSPTLRRIIIRIYKVDYENDTSIQEIFLLCMNCINYSGPIDWQLGHLKLVVQSETQTGESLFRLLDQIVGFELMCDGGITLTAQLPDY